MGDSKELKALRTMAWERTKGEIRGILHTYNSRHYEPNGAFFGINKAFREFVAKVEDNGWLE